MPNITPTNTPPRPAKRQNTASVNYSTPVRNDTTATAGFSTPVKTPVGQQQATQLKSPPKLEQKPKECFVLDVIPTAITFTNSLARNNLQQRNRNTSNRVTDTQNP